MRRLRRLLQKRSVRWSEGVCVLEGYDLIDAALDSGAAFEAIYVDEAAIPSAAVTVLMARASAASVRVFSLASGVLEKVADAKSPQPVLAEVRLPHVALGSLTVTGLTLILHDVQDPGNAGTIIRSAAAAGANAAIFTGSSVDPFNPKALRATAGSIFHLPIVVADFDECRRKVKSAGARLFATVVRGGTGLDDVDFAEPCAVVIGNEATGLSSGVVDQCDGAISIPMTGRSESLNAGVAASLIAFAAMRQRRAAGGGRTGPSL